MIKVSGAVTIVETVKRPISEIEFILFHYAI